MNPMETDPLNEVRSIRLMISKECNDDPKKVFEFYRKHQEESQRSGNFRFVKTPVKRIRAAHVRETTDEVDPE